ncbi:unnamed protein product [Rotaria sp. Silwood1]|nr:unnamed protein product [Rotaria sp. Silwood1]CAF1144114.1 unnamed protein product [Rotaria sp. Silwood1]CAF3429491.1 unnamed protein product [Rotaria sp. Silwood1]CAF4540185.1 unnamed protein product [Rotaria sp. Silwood1]
MASVIIKKPCVQCLKGGGVTTCDGCQQTFCIKHIIEHRQELAIQLDNVGQEHDIFRRDIMQDNLAHSLLIRIDEWEQESITKIQVTAAAARADLRHFIDQTKSELKVSTDKITNEIQSCRELDDFTETDLSRWVQEVKELRKLLETNMTMKIVEDENTSNSIHMIKVHEQQLSCASSVSNETAAGNNIVCQDMFTFIHEKFCNFLGKIVLTEDGLLATCSGTYWDGSTVYGTRLYVSGTHVIHFRIESKGSNNLFFGIKSDAHDMPVQTLNSPYVYGWWEFDQAIESVHGNRIHNDRIIRTGDEVTMILDCDNRQIHFEHHRINMMIQLPIELQKCPFPWRILITLRSIGDSIRILI